MQTHTAPQYRVYLLKCWHECVEGSDSRLWRFSLENARTGLRQGFTSLEEVAAALQAALPDDQPDQPGA
jgi:hypothetical protein